MISMAIITKNLHAAKREGSYNTNEVKLDYLQSY